MKHQNELTDNQEKLIQENLKKQAVIQDALVHSLDDYYTAFSVNRKEMMTPGINVPRLLIFQELIGMIEFLQRHVAKFAMDNNKYEHVHWLLTPEKQEEITQFRLKFLEMNLASVSPQASIFFMRHTNSQGVNCQKQNIMTAENFMRHFKPIWKSNNSIEDMIVSEAWIETPLNYKLNLLHEIGVLSA